MTIELSSEQQGELRQAFDAIQREFAPIHRATRKALLVDRAPQTQELLGAWLDGFFELSDEVAAWSLASQQTDVPELDNPLVLRRFQTLVSLPLDAQASQWLIASSGQFGEHRVLALAVLIALEQRGGLASSAELAAELTRTKDVEATWALLDWFSAEAHTGVLQAVAEQCSTARRARLDAQRAQEDDATCWLRQRGFSANEAFAVSIRLQDLPASHPKLRHLREQISSLDLRITSARVRGPDLDESWALVLRGGRGEPKHDFAPCAWSGDLRQLASKTGEVRGTFAEASPTPIRKGRSQVIAATLESIPEAIDAIEALAGRSFRRETASITAHIGARHVVELEEAARAWLMKDSGPSEGTSAR